jgi:hypothetical protein
MKEFEVHVAGVGALSSGLQNPPNGNTRLAMFRPFIWDTLWWLLVWASAPTMFFLYCNGCWPHGDRTRDRLNYLQMMAQLDGRAKTNAYIYLKFSNGIKLLNYGLSQRRNGRPVSKLQHQSILDDTLSWIEVVEGLENPDFQEQPSGICEAIRAMKAGQDTSLSISGRTRELISASSSFEFFIVLIYYALIISTGINASATIIEGLLSTRVQTALVCLYRTYGQLNSQNDPGDALTRRIPLTLG